MFVDDEPIILDTAARMLAQSKEGWDAKFCLNVDDALRITASHDFDVIIADIRMPGKDGFILLRALQSNDKTKQIPVIILTGDGDHSLKRRALDSGATDLLNKPVKYDDLIARIRSALRIKSYQDQLASQVDLLEDLVRERTRQLEISQRETVWRLAKAGEFRDDQTGEHVARVAWGCLILAEGLGLEPAHADLLFQTSPLHDIGKIGIPDGILLKPDKLTPLERGIMERHTLMGEEILSKAPRAISCFNTSLPATQEHHITREMPPLLRMACSIARHHHEKWDGSGYSDKLRGAAIPIEARITAVVDVYDALLSERPYKRAMPEEQAQAYIKKESEHHFDPAVVKAFFDNLERIREVYAKFGKPDLMAHIGDTQNEIYPVRR